MEMKKVITTVLACALAACGGGGDGGAPLTTPPTTTEALAAYPGTYKTACGDHAITTVTITRTATNTVSLALQDDFYQDAACTGSKVGTAVWSPFASATLASTANAAVTGYPTAGSTSTIPVDRITVTASGVAPAVSGTGLQTINGQTCVAYTNGYTCPGPSAAAGTTGPGGLYLTGSTLLLLSTTATGYETDGIFTKQ